MHWLLRLIDGNSLRSISNPFLANPKLVALLSRQDISDALGWGSQEVDVISFLENASELPSQKLLTAKILNLPKSDHFLSALDPWPAAKAFHISMMDSFTGYWLTAPLSSNPAISMSDHEFTSNLRLRMLMTTLDPNDDRYVECGCGKQLTSDDEFHCFSCADFPHAATLRIQRHDEIRDTTMAFLKKVFPLCPIQREVSVCHSTNHRADLVIHKDGGCTFLDFVVTNPASESSIQRGSHKVPLTAASCAEQAKIKKYSSFADPIPQLANNFVPFAMEITGRFGEKAFTFLNKVCKRDQLIPIDDEPIQLARAWYFRRLSTQLARNRTHLMDRCLQSFRFGSGPLLSLQPSVDNDSPRVEGD
jgi:hypothetical protein